MDKRKKRTAYHQYVIYLKMLEEDQIFRTGIIPRDGELNYLNLSYKWEELAERLNSCGHGPVMSADEWKKRLNDWKNSTRAKFRKCHSEHYKQNDKPEMMLTPLEEKALLLWGPLSNKSLTNASTEQSVPYTSPVEPDIKTADIVIKSDSDNKIAVEPVQLEAQDLVLPQVLTAVQEQELVPPQPPASSPLPQPPEPIENPKRPEKRTHMDSDDDQTFVKLRPTISIAEVKSIAVELRRIADLKAEKLKFEIAKFKFRNPGFKYNFEEAANPANDCLEKSFKNDDC